MNKLFVAIAAVFVLAAPAFAAAPPATKVFEGGKQGKVTFEHKKHADALKGDCTKCHADKAGGAIAGWAKDSAHKLCQGCHKAEGKGPTKCIECHKK